MQDYTPAEKIQVILYNEGPLTVAEIAKRAKRTVPTVFRTLQANKKYFKKTRPKATGTRGRPAATWGVK